MSSCGSILSGSSYLASGSEFFSRKILGQDHATTLVARLVYTVPVGFSAIIQTVVVANSDASNQDWSLYIPASNGTTYDKTTAVITDATILAQESEIITNAVFTLEEGDNVAWKVSVADEVTITLFGVEIAS